jgi:hypothetical protein
MTTRKELEEDSPTPDEVTDLLNEDGVLPEVVVRTNVIRTVEDTWAKVIEGNDPKFPRVMQFDGRLVRMNRETGLLQPFDQSTFLYRMAECATFVGEQSGKSQKAPKDIPSLILTRDEHPEAPYVESIAKMPFLGRDLKLHTEPGYHPEERIWLAPDIDVPKVKPEPKPEDVIEAVELLMDDWLADFAWADEASKANALALALLPFVRPAIRKATPLHICNAPEPGCGKSLLAETALMPGCGEVSMVALERWSSEQKREVTSWLIEGKPVIWFDNQANGFTVDSGLLSALLTGPKWSGRIMGKSATPNMPIRCLWLMTGNNLTFTDELARRGVLIQFDPGNRRPSERGDYPHPDLSTWTMENRAGIAYALLTLVQHWASEKRRWEEDDNPQWEPIHTSGAMKGTFEEWASVIGGILKAAGVKGFLENEVQMKQLTSTLTEVEPFLIGIKELANGEPQLLSDIAKMCREKLQDSLPQELSGERADLPKLLQTWLRDNKDGWHGKHRIVKQGTRSPLRWKVEEKKK